MSFAKISIQFLTLKFSAKDFAPEDIVQSPMVEIGSEMVAENNDQIPKNTDLKENDNVASISGQSVSQV